MRVFEFVMTAKPLYIDRSLLNSDMITKWYADQGFPREHFTKDFHVTVCNSMEPVDWGKTSQQDNYLVVPADSNRRMEKYGTATVLAFDHQPLQSRFNRLLNSGAHSKFKDYQPHVSLTYKPFEMDLGSLKPYEGPLMFGPERYKEAVEDFTPE